MDTWEEAVEYDAMDFMEVNTAFAQRVMSWTKFSARVLDAGTGSARFRFAFAKCVTAKLCRIR